MTKRIIADTLGRTCSNGHVIISHNVLMVAHGNKERAECKKCLSGLSVSGKMLPGDFCENTHEVTGWNVIASIRSNGQISYACRACKKMEAPRPRSSTDGITRGCGPHGFYPAGKCRVCNAERSRRNRQAAGQKARPVGCGPHGFSPAAECSFCNADRKRNKARENGVQARYVGCAPHGYFPATKCARCKHDWYLKKKNARLSVINAEAEYVGKIDDKPSSAWNVLRPGEQEQVALDRLNRIIERVDTNCADNPGPYQDYTVAPNPDEAKGMCHGCPALAACGIYGAVASAEWASKGRVLTGVWGGKVYGPKVLEEL